MKKIIGLVVALGLFGFTFAKAAVPKNTFFFDDGKGYNIEGEQVYFCFEDDKCYNLEGLFAFVREAQVLITNLESKIASLENQINSAPLDITPDTGDTKCHGEIGQAYIFYIFCNSTYLKTNVYVTDIAFTNNSGLPVHISKNFLIQPNVIDQTVLQGLETLHLKLISLDSLTYTINNVPAVINFKWNSTNGRFE